jgi:hypothetical protein
MGQERKNDGCIAFPWHVMVAEIWMGFAPAISQTGLIIGQKEACVNRKTMAHCDSG